MNFNKREITDYFIDRVTQFTPDELDELIKNDELHHEIFNTDYYIIGYYKARQWMGDKAFEIIGFIKDYEMDNFGEVYTDLSSEEAVVNMYVYIIGEEIVSDFTYNLK